MTFFLISASFTVVRKRAIYAAIGAVIAVALLAGLIFYFNRSNDTSADNLHGGGIVANGLECAAIAKYELNFK